jgi:hypothetical protein
MADKTTKPYTLWDSQPVFAYAVESQDQSQNFHCEDWWRPSNRALSPKPAVDDDERSVNSAMLGVVTDIVTHEAQHIKWRCPYIEESGDQSRSQLQCCGPVVASTGLARSELLQPQPSVERFNAVQTSRSPNSGLPRLGGNLSVMSSSAAAAAAVTPSCELSGAAAGHNGERVSSLLQRASGRKVVISAEAQARSARFMNADSGPGTVDVVARDSSTHITVHTLLKSVNPFPSSIVASSAAPTVTGPVPVTPACGLSGADGVAGGGRVSSLLQRASGKEVVISAVAHAGSARFMGADSGRDTTQQSTSTYTIMQTPVQPVNPFSTSTAAHPAAAPTVATIAVTPYSGLSEAGGAVGGGGRVSPLLQRASGREVVISAEAQARSARFMSTDAGSVAVVAPSSSAFTAEQSPRQTVKPFPAAVAAVTPGPTITAPVPVTPGSVLDSALAEGMSGAGRVSSLLQRASGKEVVISAEARARSARFMGADSGFGPVAAQGGSADTTVQAPQQPPNPFPSTMSVPTVAAPSLVAGRAPVTPGSGLSGAGLVAGGGRVSSLLQRASGREVVISAEAQARSARFINADSVAGAQSSSAHATLQTPHLAVDKAPSAAAPTVTRAVPVTPGSSLSGAEGVAGGGRVSSLLQRASGKEVVISAEAQVRSARFISADPSTGAQSSSAHTTLQTPHLADDPSSASMAAHSAAALTIKRAVPVTPGSSLSGAGVVAAGGRVSSLLQRASGREVVISAEAQARSARFMGAGSGSVAVVAESSSAHTAVQTPQPSANPFAVFAAAPTPAPSATGFVPVTPGGDLRGAGGGSGGSRVSSLLQRASGREVVISAEAQARSASFMSADPGFGPAAAQGGSTHSTVQRPQQPLNPFPSSTAAPSAAAPSLAPERGPVTPGSGLAGAGLVAGGGRVSSLLQRASGREVVISAEAQARSARFLSTGLDPVVAESSSAQTTIQTPQQLSYPVSTSVAGPTVAVPILVTGVIPVTPGRGLGSAGTREGNGAGVGRVSSLLQRASGREVVISAEAQARSARFMIADPGTGAQSNSARSTLQTPHLADDPSSASMAAPTAAAPTATRAVSVTPGSGLSGAGVVAAGGRVSLLLQRASGKEVVISAEAQARSARFMSTDLGAAILQGTDVHTEGPTSPSTVNPFGTSAAAPLVAVAVPVTPGSGLSGAGGVGGSGRVSSLLQRASGKEVVISAEAQARSARFMSTAPGAPVIEASLVPDQTLRQARSIPTFHSAHPGSVREVTPTPGARDPMLSVVSVGTDTFPSAGLVGPRSLSFVPYRSSAVNLPPSVIANRMASRSAAHTVMSALTHYTPAAEATSIEATSKKRSRSVRFRDEIAVETYDVDHSDEEAELSAGVPEVHTPTVDPWHPTAGAMTAEDVDEYSSSPLTATLQHAVPNPARVLFTGPESPLSATSQLNNADTPTVVSSVCDTPEPAVTGGSIVTPAVDRASLLYGDVLHGLFSLPGDSTDEIDASRNEWLPLDAPRGEDTHATADPSSSCGVKATEDVGDPQDSCPARATDAARLQLLRTVTSQNVLTTITFTENGKLVQNNGYFTAGLPLLDRLCAELAEADSVSLTGGDMREWLNMQLQWALWTFASRERRQPEAYLWKLLHWEMVRDCLKSRLLTYTQPSASAPVAPAIPNAAGVRSAGASTPYAVQTAGKKRRLNMYNAVTPLTAAVRPSPTTDTPLAREACTESETVPCGPSATLGGPRRSAAQHFSKRGAMSPLQRCSDIACFVWPMVLCFSALPPSSAPLQPAAGSTRLRVTDGWWWTTAQLDADLLTLYNTVSA